jgi:hypothetical protein
MVLVWSLSTVIAASAESGIQGVKIFVTYEQRIRYKEICHLSEAIEARMIHTNNMKRLMNKASRGAMQCRELQLRAA